MVTYYLLFNWKGLINDMKTLVIYTSQTGFTKRYAEWISEELNADIYNLKDVKKKTNDFFEAYEAIIYAGWCMAGMVVKVKWFFERAAYWKNKKLSIVAVGASPNENPEVDEFLNNLLTDEQRTFIKAFYCQGGINYDKMKFPSRTAMKMFANSLKNNKNSSEDDRKKGEMISKSYDISDKRFIDPVVDYVRGKDNE
jgi:menaquinone-dependent protoporphyrinogen IX oxidase